MLVLSSNSKIYLCTGHTDLRKGINGLSLLAQEIELFKLEVHQVNKFFPLATFLSVF